MLVFLEVSPKSFMKMKRNERLAFFRKFVRASREGNHVFVIQHSLAKWVAKRDFLNEDVKSQIAHIYQVNGYLSFDEVTEEHDYMEIRYGDGEPTKKSSHRWTVGHKKIIEGDYLDRCKLLVENELSDGIIYDMILNNEKSKYTVGTERLNYEIVGGDGNNIENKFDELVRKRTVFCCICDSDKLSPDDDPGITYKNVKKRAAMNEMANSKGAQFLGYLNCTPCHESENMLSANLIHGLLTEELNQLSKNERSNKGSIANLKTAIKNLQDLEVLLNKQVDPRLRFEMWLHFDTREGLNCRNNKIATAGEKLKSWICNCYSIEDFSEINIQKIHADIMKMFLKSDSIKREFHRHMREHMYWDDIFSKWVKEFIWYLYGQEKNNYISPMPL